ncbi:hypothetical protein IB279_27265 [Ensifer sp. ENS06]|uniref:hypothetical protein n=1 Tax=Ensifer sp. ENS06 TaxID=2769276 RepID=UPI00178356EA|nr:hypothetical protein [Ensifer sp. ENS06]MBD9626650.1 hypothetical protein [Ensifer sp. ENS06]
MKTPQRRFVVEFKSGRRQPKVQAGSIWGNTDLKTLAREVENEAAHLFGRQELNADGGIDPASDAHVPSFVDEPAVITAPEPANEVADQVAAAHLISNVADEARETAIGPLTVARTRGLPKRASGKHPPRPSPRTASEPTEQQLDLESRLAPTMLLEELVSLDAENSRLRKLLGEQLRAQNVTLKKMLERF